MHDREPAHNARSDGPVPVCCPDCGAEVAYWAVDPPPAAEIKVVHDGCHGTHALMWEE